jgi:acyl-CoA thioester hydrolase
MSHKLDLRVYYEDTDAAGIVFYANYLRYAERGRTELLRSIGYENKSLMDNEGIAFVVRHIEADYHKPAYLDDELVIKTTTSEIKNASFVMKQEIFKEKNLIFDMKVTIACINIGGKLTKLPENLKQALLNG